MFNQCFVEQRLATAEKKIGKHSFDTAEQLRAVESTWVKRISNAEQTVRRELKEQVADAKEVAHRELENLRVEITGDRGDTQKEPSVPDEQR